MTTTQDILDVTATVDRSFTRPDRRDFDGYRALLADRVTVDFGGVNDDSAGEIAADDMTASARTLVGPVHLTQHMISNHVADVDGDDAVVSFYEQALHHHPALGDDPQVNTWTLFGRGEHRLRRTAEGWRIVAMRLEALHHTGNADLLADVAALGARDEAGPSQDDAA